MLIYFWNDNVLQFKIRLGSIYTKSALKLLYNWARVGHYVLLHIEKAPRLSVYK